MVKRLKAKKTGMDEEGFKTALLSIRKRSRELVWWIGMIGGLSLIFLFPPDAGVTFLSGLGMFILIALFVGVLLVYTWHFWPDFLTWKRLCLITLLIISTALIGRIIILLPQISNYFIPIAFLSILLSLLFAPYLSVTVTLVLAVLFSISAKSLEILPTLIFGGMMGVYIASFVHQRTDLTRGGLYVGISNLCAVIATELINHRSLSEVASSGLWGMGNGIFSSILAMGVLPYLETYFGITTDIKLVELANLNLPLLKRLSIEAPGTYHHCVMVANLAEAAAEAVGANPILARVGAYYHDIGKVIRPYFFFENSGANKENYHEKITPNLSSTIIISHVKDGVELAQRSRLPQVVIDIIAQHHGNGLIAYFYREALMKMGKDRKEVSINEENFRYPGPKPQTKEAAVVMLADSVEAAFRFSPQRTPKGVATQIKKVINNKLKDNQLDECDLTMRDTAKITEAFTRVLGGAVHTRGRYPAEMVK